MHGELVEKELATVLKAVRKMLGLTRGQAAAVLLERTGVKITVATLLNYEEGHRKVSVGRLSELARAYSTSAPMLLSAAEHRAQQKPL